MRAALSIAIQGEAGSNSHLAALEMLTDIAVFQLLPCRHSADVIAALLSGQADAAVLPIENSLHGSVAEHYDLLLEHPIRIDREGLLRVRHNLIAAPGVVRADVRHILSHPVALSQCRHFLAAETHAQAGPFYDTAGSVKHLMAQGLRDTAAIAPALAAEVYGAHILAADIEDNRENFTRFHLLRRAASPRTETAAPNKLSLAFTLEHRPGTLVAALQALAAAGLDLTRIESRPVPGRPWEYVFYVDFRFDDPARADAGLHALRLECGMVKELGRYAAA
jgi:prephenate dehydratase